MYFCAKPTLIYTEIFPGLDGGGVGEGRGEVKIVRANIANVSTRCSSHAQGKNEPYY